MIMFIYLSAGQPVPYCEKEGKCTLWWHIFCFLDAQSSSNMHVYPTGTDVGMYCELLSTCVCISMLFLFCDYCLLIMLIMENKYEVTVASKFGYWLFAKNVCIWPGFILLISPFCVVYVLAVPSCSLVVFLCVCVIRWSLTSRWKVTAQCDRGRLWTVQASPRQSSAGCCTGKRTYPAVTV